MSELDRKRRIREEERIRHEARRELERRDAARQRDLQESYDRDAQYVNEYGREVAAKITFRKWFATGVFFSVVYFIGGWPNQGFVEVSKATLSFIAFFSVIGMWRASKFGSSGL